MRISLYFYSAANQYINSFHLYNVDAVVYFSSKDSIVYTQPAHGVNLPFIYDVIPTLWALCIGVETTLCADRGLPPEKKEDGRYFYTIIISVSKLYSLL